jgi:uncharacterized protein (TIGR03435 family)
MSLLSPILMQPWAERLGWTLVHFLWQGTLIATLYGVVRTFQASTGTARFRYALACVTLLAMVIAPIVTFILSASPESPQPEGRIAGAIVSFGGNSGANWLVPITAGALRIWRYRTSWIALVWCMGVAAFCARLAGGWILASRIRRSTLPVPEEWQRSFATLHRRLRISPRVRLVASSYVSVPVVVGWLRPIVLAPLYAFAGMERPLIEALFAHELAHIRRRDYLVNLLQGFVEAALFYHPAVWWISGHIRRERELCCDDIAASACGDTLVYVRALTELAAFRLPRSYPALAANDGSLTERIARLLGMADIAGVANPSVRTVPAGPVLAITAAALLVVLLATAGRGYSQIAVLPAVSLPAFEAASIRPSDPDSQLKIDFAAGGRLIVTHATLRFLIKIAYDISDDQIAGGPSWINDRRFDVQAKPASATGGDPQAMTKEQILTFHEPIRLRLQRLLADRFQLGLRKESKPMPVFALIVGAKGPRLKTDSSPGDIEMKTGSGRGLLAATRVDMPALAHFLSEGQVGRPVTDMTGLTGKFDFRLEWTPDPTLNPLSSNSAANQPNPADSGGVSIFTALQQQLGLKLEPRTSPSDYLVVTRAELPSEN